MTILAAVRLAGAVPRRRTLSRQYLRERRALARARARYHRRNGDGEMEALCAECAEVWAALEFADGPKSKGQGSKSKG